MEIVHLIRKKYCFLLILVFLLLYKKFLVLVFIKKWKKMMIQVTHLFKKLKDAIKLFTSNVPKILVDPAQKLSNP